MKTYCMCCSIEATLNLTVSTAAGEVHGYTCDLLNHQELTTQALFRLVRERYPMATEMTWSSYVRPPEMECPQCGGNHQIHDITTHNDVGKVFMFSCFTSIAPVAADDLTED